MATWQDFETAEPEMAAIGKARLKPAPIMFLATVRRDGAPRVHPVCPIFASGRMYVAVAGGGRVAPSPKRWDLVRDGRYALHALPGKNDEEFYVTGRARRVEDAAERAAVVAAAGHTVHDADWVFELAIDRAMTAYWENWTKPDTYAVRRFWRP
ncbi:MAG TPA: pyridoxamine 5'-phosphate oxidase family protein [Dehalococcoidia bacterium]|nr:pyridoxamine 5'-phosphate oxidase family protein [Dehalococcoidia bacterium]